MRKILLSAFIMYLISGCNTSNETKILSSYLHSFGVELNHYKVVAFVPSDGCSACITPTLDYIKNGNDCFLVVISSISEKTINHIVQSNRIDTLHVIKDSHDLAAEMGFVPIIAPRYYFIKRGRIVKSIDLSEINDKVSILGEVDKYLAN